jgi:hypothetical protein
MLRLDAAGLDGTLTPGVRLLDETAPGCLITIELSLFFPAMGR